VALDADALLFERLLPALTPSVARVRHELTGVLDRGRLAPERVGDILLVLSEAAANVVVHAYGVGPPGPLYTSATLRDRTLTISVIDFGRGLDVPSERPGGGFGLALLEQLSDRVQIRSNLPDAGTSVHASFDDARVITTRRPPVPEAVGHARIVREYSRVLAETHATASETAAVLAEARQALAHARTLREARQAARRKSGAGGRPFSPRG
jgi:anti-sigma regulatory factor (Ser/Thr protein kinase)